MGVFTVICLLIPLALRQGHFFKLVLENELKFMQGDKND